MFRVNLIDLDRAGSLRIRGELAPDDPLWSETALELAGPAAVDLDVTETATGQVIARGSLETVLVHECRRCLRRVERGLGKELAIVWEPADELAEEDDPEIRPLPVSTNEIELGPVIREELILSAPRYVLCEEDCKGLCPRCGINRNLETCDCTLVEPDPRWDALRELKNE